MNSLPAAMCCTPGTLVKPTNVRSGMFNSDIQAWSLACLSVWLPISTRRLVEKVAISLSWKVAQDVSKHCHPNREAYEILQLE